jgi:O-antigen/teichoic acid export membrane protein
MVTNAAARRRLAEILGSFRGEGGKRVARLVSARVAGAIMQAITMVVLARSLGASDFGTFCALLSVGLVAGSLLGFGGASQALRMLREEQADAVAATLLIARAVTAIAISGLILLGSHIIGWAVVAPLAAVYVLTELVIELSQALLMGRALFVRAEVLIVSRRAIPLLALALVPLGWVDPLVALALGWACSMPLAGAVLWGSLSRPAPLRKVLHDGRHFWLATAVGNLQQLDVPVLALVAPPALIGHYAAAARLTSPLTMISSSIMSYMTPQMAGSATVDGRRAIFYAGRRGTALYGLLLIAASPVVAAVLPQILGPEYRSGGVLFAACSVAAAINGVGQTYASYLYAAGGQKLVAQLRMVALPVNIIALAVAGYLGNMLAVGAVVVLAQLLNVALLHWATSTGVRDE